MALELKEKLTKILMQRNLIKEADLQKAITYQREKGGSLSDVLVALGLISKSDLVMALAEHLGIPPINLGRFKVDPAVLELISKKTARRYRILPIAKMGDMLTIAISDPLNIFALDDMKTLTGFKISPIVTTEKEIDDAIGRYYGEEISSAFEKIVTGMGSEELSIKSKQEAALPAAEELVKKAQEAPVVKITNILIAEGIKVRASDIFIEPLENESRVRYRVDGVLQEGQRLPKALHASVISRLKVISELNIAEHRLPQDSRFKIKVSGKDVDFRISILPSVVGEKAAIRVLDKSQATLDINKLGLDQKSIDDICEAARKPYGMILVCGPTGCGKTTTLYSILQLVNSPQDNIVTVEDPIEYIIEGVNQVAARPETGLTFAASLRSILRQDPDTIMIGEIRDLETVDIAIKAALTGHLVLSTLHTTTATGSIVRLINMGVEPFLISSSIIMAAAQRLVRKICQNCKEPYSLGKDVAAKFFSTEPSGKVTPPPKAPDLSPGWTRAGFAPDEWKPPAFRPGGVTFYRGKGCPKCQRTGYKGRTALIEVLMLTSRIKELILAGAQEYAIREAARAEGMRTLRENGIQKALDGVTTLDEVVRVTVGDQDMETA